MALTITGLAGGRVSREDADAFERAVRETLPSGADLVVRFGVWEGEEDGRRRLVCKVESPPCDPLLEGPQWRWWSPLLTSPAELRGELQAALAARERALAPRAVARPAERSRAAVGA